MENENLFKTLIDKKNKYGPEGDESYILRISFIPYKDGTVEIGEDYFDINNREISGGGNRVSREEAIKIWNKFYNDPDFEIDNSNVIDLSLAKYIDESTNKYVQAFREAVEKLEEENAATRHFRGDTESNRQGWGKSNLISDANDIFASIERFLAEYDTMSNSQEYKTNSQTARVYKMIEKMHNIIPDTYGADAYNSDMGNKDAVDYTFDNEGNAMTTKWRYK